MFRYKQFRREVGISQIDLARLLGCGQPNVSAMERTDRQLETDQEAILRERYGNDIIDRFSYTVEEDQEEEVDLVPLLPVEAMAGSLQGLSEGVELANCRKIKSPVRGADWAIQISGDSMEPDYKNGSYLFIKKLSGSFVPWGHTLVVDTYDGVVVKNIFESDSDPDYIVAESINPKYPDFLIEKSSIIGLYRVLGGSFINSTI